MPDYLDPTTHKDSKRTLSEMSIEDMVRHHMDLIQDSKMKTEQVHVRSMPGVFVASWKRIAAKYKKRVLKADLYRLTVMHGLTILTATPEVRAYADVQEALTDASIGDILLDLQGVGRYQVRGPLFGVGFELDTHIKYGERDAVDLDILSDLLNSKSRREVVFLAVIASFASSKSAWVSKEVVDACVEEIGELRRWLGGRIRLPTVGEAVGEAGREAEGEGDVGTADGADEAADKGDNLPW